VVVVATPERSIERIGRYRIHALHTGTGDDLVLLHGLSGSSGWWRHNVPAFAAHYRTHTPDLVGFGRSKAWVAQPTIPDMAHILEQWMDAKNIRQIHLIGHSMGGQVAIHLATKIPDRIRKLVLVSSAGIPRHLKMTSLMRLLAEVVPPRRWGNPSFLPTIARDVLRAGPRAVLGATTLLLRDDVRPLLPLIQTPTLLIWGKLDPLTPFVHGEFMAQHIPGARLIAFDDAAHMPMVDRPERFNREVLDFLAQS
jgi:pimeloyl-ACP methyl ester carboxylesterase